MKDENKSSQEDAAKKLYEAPTILEDETFEQHALEGCPKEGFGDCGSGPYES